MALAGRPDMAYHDFAVAIRAGWSIRLFNYRQMARDFTDIDDVVEAMVRLLDLPPAPLDRGGPYRAAAPFVLYNVGNQTPDNSATFSARSRAASVRAIVEDVPLEAGDGETSFAAVAALQATVGFSPATPLQEGPAHCICRLDFYHGNQ